MRTGKKALEVATGLDKSGRVARAKKRRETELKAEREVESQMMSDILAHAFMVAAENDPMKRREKKEEKPDE